MGCPETLWMSHGWKRSRSDWMGLWETWSSERCPSPYQGGWTRWPLKVPSSPKHSVTHSKDFSWQQRPHPECLSLCLHNPAKPLLHTDDQFMCIWLQLLSPTSVNHLPSCMWLKNECFQPKPVHWVAERDRWCKLQHFPPRRREMWACTTGCLCQNIRLLVKTKSKKPLFISI